MLKLRMRSKEARIRLLAAWPAVFAVLILAVSLGAQDKPTNSSNVAVAKAVGAIKTVQADSITLASESGGDVTAKITPSTKILRVPPGEKDLKNATAVQLPELQPGDRVLVRGQATSDAKTITALAVIVMKQGDVAAKQEHDRDDWQKRGVGGLVTKIDPEAGVITISSGMSRTVAVHVGKNTILRRYPPDSVKFDDAKPAPLDQIKVGDQLRARGVRSADGNDLTAEEVVTGSFRNIAGTIRSIDAANNTMTVQDAISKSPVVVKVSPDSQMKKLPPEMAQRIAIRLKAAGTGGQEGSGAQGAGGQGVSRNDSAGKPGSDSQSARGPGAAPGGNGPPDLQRLLSRLPNSTLADLQKGDAVMIVSTAGNSDGVTAITLLAGVDPILTAAPNRSASSLLTPWSLGAGAEGEAAQQ